jgi:hypothetical protein
MSAYGAIPRATSSASLPSTLWPLTLTPTNNGAPQYLTIHHLTLATAQDHHGLLDYLHQVFADEIERGQTYPQETLQGEMYARESFDAYFFAGDVFLAITGREHTTLEAGDHYTETDIQLRDAHGGRNWDQSVAGFYYVRSIRRRR